MCKTLSHEECIVLGVLEREACTSCDCPKRVLCYIERNVYLVTEALCKSSEERAATCKVDTVLHNVRIKFRWSLFEYMKDAVLDSGN